MKTSNAKWYKPKIFNPDVIKDELRSHTFVFIIPDTENIRFVFAAVKDTILQLNLKEYNLV